MQIKFWGARGSYPVPGAGTVRFGGNTPCIEIQANGQTIIFDAGTGIIQLGRALMSRAPLEATLIFSHYHHDHIQGFPFFTPGYMPSTRLHCFGPAGLEAVLQHNQKSPMFPVTVDEMAAEKDFHTLQGGELILVYPSGAALAANERVADHTLPEDTALIRSLRSYAHPGGVLFYRVEYRGNAVVYATDTEGYVGTDRRLVAFAQNADVLIHDAQYTEEHYRGQRKGCLATQGFGHSTVSMACEVAAAAHVKQLVMFHHDPGYDDDTICGIEKQARTLFPGAAAAYEGLEITLKRAEKRQTASMAAL